VPAYARSTLSERELCQHHIGKARGLVEASKRFLFGAVADAYEVARTGDVGLAERKQIQMAATFAAEAAVNAVDLVYEAAGTSGFSGDLRFARYFRDVHTIAQHAGHSLNRHTSVGKVELGMPGDVPILL
jgi:alkylation response protein AidB-like acyl-CoA dehydrogenase